MTGQHLARLGLGITIAAVVFGTVVPPLFIFLPVGLGTCFVGIGRREREWDAQATTLIEQVSVEPVAEDRPVDANEQLLRIAVDGGATGTDQLEQFAREH